MKNDRALSKAKPFKELDLTAFEDAEENWFKLIREDKLLSWGLSLDKINEEFEWIHKAISHTSIARKIPSLTKLPFIGSFFNEDVWMKLRWFEWKLTSIFNAYDDNYKSLLTSWKLYNKNISWLEIKIKALVSHKKLLKPKTDNEKLYGNKVSNLIVALTWAQTRMKINLNTAEEIRIQMHLNRPIFKTLINTLVIEKTWEIGLKAAQNSLDVMNKFISKTNDELTDSTIEFAKEINQKKYDPTISEGFKNNLAKLWKAIEEIAEIKRKAVIEFEKRWVLSHKSYLITKQT